MANIILVSFFNSNNIGDRLISNELLNEIESAGHACIKCSYEGTFNIYGNTDGLTVNSVLPPFYYRIIRLIGRVLNYLRLILFWHDYKKQICIADALVIGGGNMIMDLGKNSKNTKHFLKYVKGAKRYGKVVFAISIGAGPFQRPHQIVDAVSALSICDYVTYRDEDSYKIINGNSSRPNHFISIDPVFLIAPRERSKKDPSKKAVGICVINPQLYNPDLQFYYRIMEHYITLINKISEKGYRIYIFSTEKKDYTMVTDVMGGIKTDRNLCSSIEINSWDDLLDLYSHYLDLLIGTRMHSLIVAYTQHLPIIGLSWQQKINSMFDIIDRKKFCHELINLGESCDLITEQMEYLLNMPVCESEYCSANKIIRAKNEINKKIIASLGGI